MKLKVYIAGPITGLPNGNRDSFDHMEQKLRENGFEPINPHITCKDIVANHQGDDEQLWEACMRADIRELMTADCIVALPGWEKSRGAHLEVGLAEMLGIKRLKIDFKAVDGAAEQ